MPTDRLAKVIARTGRASRREAEGLVAEGRVRVNNEVATHPGQPVDPARDEIRVDGKPLPSVAPHVYYLLNKPKGVITTCASPR